MDTYVLEKLTGWTPDLSPPPDSPLYKWRQLAEGRAVCHRPGVCFNAGESDSLLTKHDLIRKSVPTFRDHALALADAAR
jgi:hypothetical protein